MHRKKWAKNFGGRYKGEAGPCRDVVLGDIGLKAAEAGEIKESHIKAAKDCIKKQLKDSGKLYIRVIPSYAVTKKPLKVKLGGGKGRPSHHSAFVRAGRVLMEIQLGGIDFHRGADIMRQAASKLPIKTYSESYRRISPDEF